MNDGGVFDGEDGVFGRHRLTFFFVFYSDRCWRWTSWMRHRLVYLRTH
jgi:hypothetical protein